MIVIRASNSQDHARLINRRVQGRVEQLVRQEPIEALDEAILHGRARRDIIPCNPLLLYPANDRIAGELRSVVAVTILVLPRSAMIRSSS